MKNKKAAMGYLLKILLGIVLFVLLLIAVYFIVTSLTT